MSLDANAHQEVAVRITYREVHGPYGGNSIDIPATVLTYTGVLLLTPFVQSLASSVGSKVGERLDQSARDALRRLMRRHAVEAESLPQVAEEAGGNPPVIFTRAARPRVVVEVHDDISAEALLEITRMNFEELFGLIPQDDSSQCRLIRLRGRWVGYLADGQPAFCFWYSEGRKWVRLEGPAE
jgi:hypothetical protein